MSKLNIFSKEWLDVVFENRNKKYGAYQLRSENPKTTSLALFMGIALLSLAVSSPIIVKALQGKLGDNTVATKNEAGPVIWDFVEPITPVKAIIEKTEAEQSKKTDNDSGALASAVSVKRHKPYTVTGDSSMSEEPTAAADLVDSNPGSSNSDGIVGGDLLGNLPFNDDTYGNTGGSDGVASEYGNKVFDFVQIKAAPVGGFAVFNKMFISRFKTPDLGAETKKLQVILRFIVEKDGSLSDIFIVRDPGYGAGKEAVRVLNSMPKWKSAVQNNRAVRSQFTLPITVQVH